MEKMTQAKKNELMDLLNRDLEYSLGGETEIYDNHAFLELYGKAYGRGRESFSKYKINNGKVELLEIDGDNIHSIAEYIYHDFLKRFPEIKTFTISIQED